MVNLSVSLFIFQLLVAIGIFAGLVFICKFIVNNVELKSSIKNSRFLNPLEYFPSEKLPSLNQLTYLIMILVFIMICLYIGFGWQKGLIFISILDILISIYLAINTGMDSLKGKIILFLLIPFGSISRLVFGESIIVLLDLLHIIAYLYFIQFYYRKFLEYTESNGLGIAIMLLFSIILVSFLFTIIVEGVSPLDSMTMVSNAFTSNSFEASGNTTIGKLNSLVLAWGGFLLSGVGTATLSVSLVLEYVNRQFDEVEELIKNKKK